MEIAKSQVHQRPFESNTLILRVPSLFVDVTQIMTLNQILLFRS
jgi:hypothetical protein